MIDIARPQVHEHGINYAAIIQKKRNHRFIGGVEKKVSRVFEAHLSLLKTLHHATSDIVLEDVQADVQVLVPICPLLVRHRSLFT